VDRVGFVVAGSLTVVGFLRSLGQGRGVLDPTAFFSFASSSWPSVATGGIEVPPEFGVVFTGGSVDVLIDRLVADRTQLVGDGFGRTLELPEAVFDFASQAWITGELAS